jgi:hypothetical protein
MEKKIIVPKNTFDIKEFSNYLSEMRSNLKSLSDINKEERRLYFEGIVNDVVQIFESAGTYAQKQKDLILYKQKLQFKKTPPAREYEIKRIDEAINTILDPSLQNLNELIRLEKDHGVSNEIKQAITKKDINTIETPLNQLNSNESEFTQEPSPILVNGKIKMKLSKEEVKNFFYKLSVYKNELDNKPYLSEVDVEQLLAQAFEDFTDKKVNHRLLNLNFNKRQLAIFYTFIYQFYSKNENNRAGTKKKYAYFLKENFVNFKQVDIDTLYSSIRLNNELENSVDLLKKSKSS